MSSYLEAYGSSEEHIARRSRRVKRSVILLVSLFAIAGLGYVLFKNYPEERQVKTFLADLQKQDYPAAYALWGCTPANPCRDYSLQKFMDDWGPKGAHPNASSAGAHIGMSQTCGTGVLLRLDSQGSEPVPLWVERSTRVVSFAPWPECPGRHLHFGTFLRSLFNR